jgi:hypothetical protein
MSSATCPESDRTIAARGFLTPRGSLLGIRKRGRGNRPLWPKGGLRPAPTAEMRRKGAQTVCPYEEKKDTACRVPTRPYPGKTRFIVSAFSELEALSPLGVDALKGIPALQFLHQRQGCGFFTVDDKDLFQTRRIFCDLPGVSQ